MAAFRLPRLKANLAIVSSRGTPLDYFLRFWNIDVAPKIEQQEANQTETIDAIQEIITQIQANMVATQAAQQAANEAQATADAAAPGGTKSGASTDPSVVVEQGVWAEGPRVDLTGVSAGILTIQGSGWAILAWDTVGKRLIIEQLYDQQGNISVALIPVLQLDMWEHAFYLDYQNVKGDYVKAFWNIVNWADVQARFERAVSQTKGLVL